MTPVTEVVVEPAVLAAVAARAALAVPGVLRLEPGMRGLVSTWVRTGRQRFGGGDSAIADGVRVRNHADGRITVEVDVVLSTERPAAAAGLAVQREIARVLAEHTGQRVAAVLVSILDIEVGA
ncbi:Asp23/Gls24 family envelope stress response protein [Nocardia sp. NPDC057353]|uniref:Asp23/Gls24 family envelope stress response protein n=1 Tax=Nocardia sp. NPDC057353 TaxID=3346104 RepID=UPI0036368349